MGANLKVWEHLRENRSAAIATAVAATTLAGYGTYVLVSNQQKRRLATQSGPYPQSSLPHGAYDVAIVGAGPSGSTAAFYAAQSGARVALLDKEKFPRDKFCGDAVCTPAIRILEDMGVLQELRDNNEAKFADNGGFVSPSGLSYIGECQFSVSRLWKTTASSYGQGCNGSRRPLELDQERRGWMLQLVFPCILKRLLAL